MNIYIYSWPAFDLMCVQRLLDVTVSDSRAESQRFMSADTNGHPHSHDGGLFLFFVYICVVLVVQFRQAFDCAMNHYINLLQNCRY